MRAILSEHEDNQTELQSGLNDHTQPRNSRAEPSRVMIKHGRNIMPTKRVVAELAKSTSTDGTEKREKEEVRRAPI